jgi:hypothetical protein
MGFLEVNQAVKPFASMWQRVQECSSKLVRLEVQVASGEVSGDYSPEVVL